MKELIIDLTMVGLLLFGMNGLFNNHYIQNEMVSKNIVALNKMYKNKTHLFKVNNNIIEEKSFLSNFFDKKP